MHIVCVSKEMQLRSSTCKRDLQFQGVPQVGFEDPTSCIAFAQVTPLAPASVVLQAFTDSHSCHFRKKRTEKTDT